MKNRYEKSAISDETLGVPLLVTVLHPERDAWPMVK